MLTKNDIDKIRDVVREEVEVEVGSAKTELGYDIASLRLEASSETRELKDRLKNIEIGNRKIQKDLKYAINFLDKQDIGTQKRIKRIEEHLNFPEN